ncbi:hypothetical protein SAMN05216296_0697 [Pseudomonas pohangensis]|uniref:Uncharacterized protein n=1 Tax=Pseudomonas pohangensis TaxID=364197 RepID=A0A1H2EE93_9PSED|nr:hypothetical protein SAMN05216296_0697 [Pseudomonas pohangensis]
MLKASQPLVWVRLQAVTHRGSASCPPSHDSLSPALSRLREKKPAPEQQ